MSPFDLSDYFIAKYDANGLLQSSKQVGAICRVTLANGISVDHAGNSYVTGFTNVGLSDQTQTGVYDYFNSYNFGPLDQVDDSSVATAC
jgi:hypothetical protein